MVRRGALLVGAGALLLLLLVSSSASPVELWGEAGGGGSLQVDPPPLDLPESEAEPADLEFAEPEDAGVSPVLRAIFAAATILAAACIVALLLRAIWRHLRRQRGYRFAKAPPAGADFPEVIDVVAALADATDPAEPSLTRGTPRNAIVACWMRLCAAVESAGLAPDPAETSTELTQRVLANYALDRQPVEELSALYREARFSDHELTEADRRRALASLGDVHDQFLLAVELHRKVGAGSPTTGSAGDEPATTWAAPP